MQLTRRGRRLVAAVLGLALAGASAAGTTAAVRWFRDDVVLSQRCTATAGGGTHSLAPDQASSAATITALALRRGLPARAATIGIATAIQESKLRNIHYGDRDSLGLFQQRPSQGWGTPEQVTDPVFATNAFYDALEQVEGYQHLEVTDAAQRVQRSAFGDAYADHESAGRVFASALAGHSAAALTCRLRPVEPAGGEAQPDGDGLVPRATAVRDTLSLELGIAGWSAAADGRRLLVDPGAGGEDGTRRAWAAAHWAVAKAADLDVVRVAVGGREWRRDEPARGWVETADPDGPAGVVVVDVAG